MIRLRGGIVELARVTAGGAGPSPVWEWARSRVRSPDLWDRLLDPFFPTLSQGGHPMDHPPSILDRPSIQVELDIRQAFGLAVALGSYLSHLGGPVTGIQQELAGLAMYLRHRLPAQCRDLLDAPVRRPLAEGR